ncbi:MAG TPA: alkaline phosphatase family protein [Anaerolineales bacterium]|nr:alkaline phosphatase family protein [Anaerolineales bacterium]
MKQLRRFRYLLGVLAVTLLLPSTSAQADMPSQASKPNTPIEHFIVLMQENHTFDNYFGTYPGVDGIPAGMCMPVDPFDSANTDCVEPYHIGDRPIDDLDHSLGTFQSQYNDGNMNGFVYALNQRNQNGALSMGYYDGTDLPYYWNIADQYVLFDRFFSSDHGGSFANHMYWVTAQPGGSRISTDGYSDLITIFDRLEERGISWKFYVQNYDPKITYRSASQVVGNRSSQIIWVPLLNIDRFIDNPKLSSHIVDLNEYYKDLENGTLPAVAYIAPSGASEHPPGSIRSGQKFVKALIQALMRSDSWDSSAFLLLYDDWGGWYDHVKPPQVDKHGYGLRVPGLLVSAYARRGYVDSTVLDFTSVPKFIEENWNLEPIAERDAKSNSFMKAFDFSQSPRQPFFVPFERVVKEQRIEPRRIVIYAAYGGAIVLAILMFIWTAVGSDLRQKSLAYFNSRTQPREP